MGRVSVSRPVLRRGSAIYSYAVFVWLVLSHLDLVFEVSLRALELWGAD